MTALATGPSYLRPTVPEGIVHNEPHEHTTDWSDWLRSSGNAPISSAPLWTVQRKPRVINLRRPLLVRVYADGEYFFASNETLSIYGTGATLEEAMADFCLHTIHFYNYYRALPSTKLIGHAVQLKKIFDELFREE